MPYKILKLIEKFLSNDISEGEMHLLLQAYRHKQISEEQFDAYYARKWGDAGKFSSPLADESRERAWEQLKEYTAWKSVASTKQDRKKRWIMISSVAAIGLIFFMLGITALLNREYAGHEVIVQVENGQKATIQLPDGSHAR